jgi:DNA-binding protein H-NS
MATLANIQAKLQAQADAMVRKESLSVIAKISDLMETHGISLADLESHLGSVKRRGRTANGGGASRKRANAARYLDPKTGATWTGHGRAPAWIANAKDRSKYLIGGSMQRGTSAATDVKKQETMCADRKRRNIAIRKLVRRGADVAAPRRGWLTPKTEQHS